MLHFAKLLSDLDTMSGRVQERVHAHEVRLGTWLVVGNSGALLLSFNALLDQKICDWPTLAPLVYAFAAGLGTAFSSMLTTWLYEYRTEMLGARLRPLAIRGAVLETQYPDDRTLSQDEIGARDKAYAELNRDVLLLGKPDAAQANLAIGSWVLLGCSVGCFSIALVLALSWPQFALAICRAPLT